VSGVHGITGATEASPMKQEFATNTERYKCPLDKEASVIDLSRFKSNDKAHIPMSAVLEGLRAQRANEMRNVAGLKPLADEGSSEGVSAVLEIIVHDSRKHMALCDAMIRIESGETRRAPRPGGVPELREAILRHIELERSMLRQLEALRPLADGLNEGLIGYMLADERRHHGLLMGLIELLDRSEDGVERYDALVDRLLREAHQPGNAPR
jgi:hypothetical protein